jgi:hypothetical protein
MLTRGPVLNLKISLYEKQNLCYSESSRLNQRGVRVVTNVRRDAMDAFGAADERRSQADG